MRYTSIPLILILLSGMSIAYEDQDIDGVEDSVDECPNTPFDALVDKRGCSNTNEPKATTPKSYNGEAQQGITWFNSYSFTKNFFATASYTYALDDSSYDNTLSFALGIRF